MAKAFEGKVVLVTGAKLGNWRGNSGGVPGGWCDGLRDRAAVRRARDIARSTPGHSLAPRRRGRFDGDQRGCRERGERGRPPRRGRQQRRHLSLRPPLEQSSEELVRRQFEANVYGTTFVAQAALPPLRASRGTIVNISSAAGHKPVPGGAHYAATKAAVESLTRSWALELAPHGIRGNAVAPGPVDTPGFDKSGIPPEARAAVNAGFASQVPLGRMGGGEEVARWVAAIADPGAPWVTGQGLSVARGTGLT